MPHLPSNSMTPQPGGTVPKVTPSPSSSSASVNTGIRGSTSPVQSKGNTENEPEPEDDTTVQQTSTKRKEETFSKWLQVVEYDKAKSGTDPKSVATLEIAGYNLGNPPSERHLLTLPEQS